MNNHTKNEDLAQDSAKGKNNSSINLKHSLFGRFVFRYKFLELNDYKNWQFTVSADILAKARGRHEAETAVG